MLIIQCIVVYLIILVGHLLWSPFPRSKPIQKPYKNIVYNELTFIAFSEVW